MDRVRHVIITGGSSGLGRSIGRLLAARGDRVSLVARGLRGLEDAAAAMPGAVELASADVTDAGALDRAVADLVRRSGPCDVLVAAAGGARPGYFADLGPEVFRDQMDLNYFGVLHAVRAVVPPMVARGSGSVVAVASAAAFTGVHGFSAYAPAKFAVLGLMEVLRGELRPHGVHVGCAFPADMDTPGFAAENRTKPEECARISAGIRPRDPDAVAPAIVRGIDRRRFLITADPQTAVLARTAGLLRPVLHRFTDRVVDTVRREHDAARGAAPRS